jgi:hypothetical protein
MSLASTAAVWLSDNTNKKRVSTIRRPILKTSLDDEDESKESDIQNVVPGTIDETNTHNTAMSSRVNTLLSQLSSDNDGNRLADYEPIHQPIMTVNRDDITDRADINANDLLPQSQHPSPVKFTANDLNLAKLSNYHQTYNNPRLFQNRIHTPGTADNKLMEKINYMIRLLEEQQHEKTANVTEEFVLYMLLGVFVIFTVDSFTRAGKYVR